MSQYFVIHPDNPQRRLIRQAVEILDGGGVIAYPTDSSYALGCKMGEKKAIERIRKIRQLDDKHLFTLLCRDLSELGTYSQVSNASYRLLKALTPGPYTFLLTGTKEAPRRLLHAKRKTVGIRVPDHPVTQALLHESAGPLISATLQLKGDDHPMNEPYEMQDRLKHQVDLIIDSGSCGFEATTVIDLVEDMPTLVRQGLGDVSDYF